MALLAVFAVFAGNLERARSRSPQKSWAGGLSARKITAGRPPLLLEITSRKGHERHKWSGGAGDEICMCAIISQYLCIVNVTNNESANIEASVADPVARAGRG
jgi:hypothetical protein